MAAIVSLREVIEEMEMMSDEATAYINRKTGELITITDEMFSLAEDPDEAEDAPEWQKEFMPKVREVTGIGRLYPLCRASSIFTNGRSWNALPGRLP